MKPPRTVTMLDLETLGTDRDAVIIQIAVVKYCPSTGNCLAVMADPSIPDQIAAGRVRDFDTELWWRGQGGWSQSGVIPASAAAENVSRWLSANLAPDEEIWCAGTDFDFPLLAHFFRQFDQPVPWKHWQQRDFRTLRKIAEPLVGKYPGNSHGAFEDALDQAAWAVKCLDAALRGREPDLAREI